jgi:hypothetical protein
MLVDTTSQRVVQPEPEANEHVLWAGQPKPSRTAFKSLNYFIVGIISTAMVVSFAIPLMRGVLNGPGVTSGKVFLSVIVGLMFVGSLSTLASPLRAYSQAMRTYYAVTNKRVLIVQAGKSRTVGSYSQGDIRNIETTELPDRSGDLALQRERQ